MLEPNYDNNDIVNIDDSSNTIIDLDTPPSHLSSHKHSKKRSIRTSSTQSTLPSLLFQSPSKIRNNRRRFGDQVIVIPDDDATPSPPSPPIQNDSVDPHFQDFFDSDLFETLPLSNRFSSDRTSRPRSNRQRNQRSTTSSSNNRQTPIQTRDRQQNYIDNYDRQQHYELEPYSFTPQNFFRYRIPSIQPPLDLNTYEGRLRLDDQIVKKGLTSKQIRDLIETEYKSNSEMDQTCNICLEDYNEGDSRIVLNCIHAFHSSCIKKWLKENKTCPTCRKRVCT